MSNILYVDKETSAWAMRAFIQRLTATERDEPTNRDKTNLFATSVIAHRAGIKRADAVASVPLIIKDKAGEPLSKTDPLMRALERNYRDNMRRSELTICFWGQNLLYKRRAASGMPYSLRWVNPNLWGLDMRTKGLQGFRIAQSSQNEYIGKTYIKLSDAIYLHEIDFKSDFRGLAPIEVSFRHAELGVEMVETQVGFMQNRAVPASIVQPAENATPTQATEFNEEQRNKLQKMLQSLYQGSRNAGRTLIQRFRFEWIQLQSNFDDVEFKTHYEQSYEAVSIGFDIPVSLIRESASNFAQQREVRLDWAQSWLVPRVEWYAEGYTEQLAKDEEVLRRYGPGLVVVPDTSNVALLKEDDKSKIERTNLKVEAGYLDLYTAALEAGVKEPPEALKGKYMWNGVPTPIDQIDTLWQSKLPQANPVADTSTPQPPIAPPQEQPQQNSAGIQPEADKANEPAGKKAHIILTLPNNGDLIALQSRLKELCTGMGVNVRWLSPERFHVTLMSMPNATDQQIGILKASLDGIGGDELAMKIGQVNVFDTIGEHAIHFKISRNLTLEEVQSDLYDLCTSYGIGVITHSHPDEYDPHVTMGYADQKLRLIPFKNKIRVEPDEIQLCVGDDHEIVYRRKWLDDPNPPPKPDDAEQSPAKANFLPDELFSELKVAARKGSEFVPNKLPKCTVTYIKTLKEIGFENDIVLEAAKSFTLSVTAAKSVSATQSDFEREFDDLIGAARNDEKTRKQVSGKLRYLINKYIDRALVDALVDAGIEDAALNDEDRALAAQLKADASPFVTNFLNQLFKGDGITDDQAVYKATQWWNGSIYPAYLAGLERAAADNMFMWVLGKTEKHCDSCRALDGQRHRFSEFRTAQLMPKGDRLICGPGKLCDCDLVPSKGRSKGRLDTVPVAMRSHVHEEEETEVPEGEPV